MNIWLKFVLCVCFISLGNLVLGAPRDTVTKPSPFLPVPNPAQLKWHKSEYIMFNHFGMKTFYPNSDHMGYGKEDPKRYNPAKFDAKQWVDAAKAGGFRGIVLTTKHHDGFCNWQTETTDHCVRSSDWKNGKGDIVKELVEACRAGGISFGVYVSIIDKRFEHAGSKEYSNYGEYYLAQLTELSTKYGPLDEYWFDGYKADKLKLDYKGIAEMIKKNQPDAVVYDSGNLAKYMPDRCLSWPGRHGSLNADQNYRQKVDGVVRWYPNEPSVIWQGNWFHNNKKCVSLAQMKKDYLSTVGNSVTPLLNIPGNSDGLIDEATIVQLKEFKAWVDQLHSNDLARAAKVKVSAESVRGNAKQYAPANVIDGNFETYYATDDTIKNAVLEIDLQSVQEIEGFVVQEYIPLGQRVDGFTIECRVDGKWVEVFSGKKIGYKRIILEGQASAKKMKLPATDGIRLKIKNALACPLISTFQVIGSNK